MSNYMPNLGEFLGTMGYPNGTQNFLMSKYEFRAFKCRVARAHALPCYENIIN